MKDNRNLLNRIRRSTAALLAVLMILDGTGVQTLAEMAGQTGVEFMQKSMTIDIPAQDAEDTGEDPGENSEVILIGENEEETTSAAEEESSAAEPETAEVTEASSEEEEDETQASGEEQQEESETEEEETEAQTSESEEQETESTEAETAALPGMMALMSAPLAGASLTGTPASTEGTYDLYINGEKADGTGVSVTYGDSLSFEVHSNHEIDNEVYKYKFYRDGGPDPYESWKTIESGAPCTLAAGKYYMSFHLYDKETEAAYYDNAVNLNGKWILTVGRYTLLEPENAEWSTTCASFDKSASAEADIAGYELQLYHGDSAVGAAVTLPMESGKATYTYNFEELIKEYKKGLYHYTVKVIPQDTDRCTASSEKESTIYNYAKITTEKSVIEGVEKIEPENLDLGSGGQEIIKATINEEYIFTGWSCDPASSSVFLRPLSNETEVELARGEETTDIRITANVLKLNTVSDYVASYDAQDHELTASYTGNAGKYEISWNWYKDGSATPVHTGDILTVKNVADSGTYRAEATLTSDTKVITRSIDNIQVSITPAELKVKAVDTTAVYGSTPGYTAEYYRSDDGTKVTDPEISEGTVVYNTSYPENGPAGNTYTITTVVTGLRSANYTFVSHGTPGKLTITKKQLSAGDFTVAIKAKTYDGTTSAEVESLDAAILAVDKTTYLDQIKRSAVFKDKNAGSSKAVTVTLALDTESGKTYLYDRYTLNDGNSLSYDVNTGVINKKAITVTPKDNQSKDYGVAKDPTLTYDITGSLAAGETALQGSLTREPGESAGTYKILVGNLKTKNTNYEITFTENKIFTINKSGAISITVTDSGSKVYDKTIVDEPEYAISSDKYKGEVSFAYYTKDGENYIPAATPCNAGTYYVVATAAEDDNFKSFASAYTELTVSKCPVTVTPDAGQWKYYHESDPVIKYTVSPALYSGDTFIGGLGREGGRTVGKHNITVGSLSNQNYEITLSPEKFEIKKSSFAAPVVTVSTSSTYYSGQKIDVEVTGVPEEAATPEIHYSTWNGSTYTGDTRVQPTDAGKYEVWVIVPGNAGYEEVSSDRSKPVTFEIKKRPVTITSGTSEWSYDGKEHSNQTYTCVFTGDGEMKAFPESEGIDSITLDTKVKAHTAVPVSNEFTIDDINFKEGTKKDNYDLKLVFGTLSVKVAKLAQAKHLAWSENVAGGATWTAIANPVEGAVIRYEVALKKGNETISTETTTETHINFSDVIRSNVTYDVENKKVSGEYSFSVKAQILGDDSVASSDVADCETKIYPVLGLFTLGRGVHVTVNGSILPADGHYIFLSGESVTVGSTVDTGHTQSANTWNDTTEPEIFSFADSTQTSTTLVVNNVSKASVGTIFVASDDDKPSILRYEGENVDGLQSIQIHVEIQNLINDLKAWAVSTESDASKLKDKDWTVLGADVHHVDTTLTETVESIPSETAFYLHVKDEFNETISAAEPIHVYRISFEKGDAEATGTMIPGIKVQNKDANLPANQFRKTAFAFQNWDDGHGQSYNDLGVYKDNKDTVLTAMWAEAKFSYTVRYYFENPDETYTEDEEAKKELEGGWATVIRYDDANLQLGKEGYELTTKAGEATEIKLTENNLTLNIYYKRKTLYINYGVTGGVTPVTYSDAFKYGEDLTGKIRGKLDTSTDAEFDGYAFVGWAWESKEGAPQTMPSTDVNASGTLVGLDRNYKVVVYDEDLDGNYKKVREISMPGKTGEEISITSALNINGATTGTSYYGYIVSEAGVYGPTDCTEVDKQIKETAGTAHVSGKTHYPTVVSLYYKLNAHQITLNVYRSNAEAGEAPVYTHTFDSLMTGAVMTPSDCDNYENYEKAKWTEKYEKYRVSDIVLWSNGSRPSTMPGYNVTITRYITPIDTDVPYIIDTYFMDADGNYPENPSNTQTFYAKESQTTSGVPATIVKLATVSDMPKEEYTCYLDINSTEVTRIYTTTNWYHNINYYAVDWEKSNATITREDGEGFEEHLSVYYGNKEVTATVNYYYDADDGSNYHLFKTETQTGLWGTTWLSPSCATKYFDGNTSAVPGVGYDFRNNGYVVYYSYDDIFSNWVYTWHTLVNSASKLKEMKETEAQYLDYWKARFGLGGLTVDIYYEKVPEKQYYEVAIKYKSNLTYEETAEAPLTTEDSNGNTYTISYCDYAYVYETTFATNSQVKDYPGLGNLNGTYSYGNMRSGFSMVTVDGKSYPARNGVLYVMRSNDERPIFYRNNYTSFAYPTDAPGMQMLNEIINTYKTEHGEDGSKTYTEYAPYACITDRDWSYSKIQGNLSGTITLGFWGYDHYYHLIDGLLCPGHIYTSGGTVDPKDMITCSKQDFSKGAYIAKWYHKPDLTSPVLEDEKAETHSGTFYLYGKYVYAIKEGMDTAYYYIPGVGYVKDKDQLKLADSSSQVIKVLDGGGDPVSRTVVTNTYNYVGSDGYEYIALKERSHPSVAYSEVSVNWSSATWTSTTATEFKQSDFSVDGYYYSTSNLNNKLAGIPTADPLNLYMYYAPNSRMLTYDAVNENTGEIVAKEGYKTYTSIVTVAKPSRKGYAFNVWKITKTATGEAADFEYTTDPDTGEVRFHMPNYAVTMKAEWKPAPFSQKISYHYQNDDLVYDDDAETGSLFEKTESLTSEATWEAKNYLRPATLSNYFELDTIRVTYAEEGENVLTLTEEGTAEVKVGMTIDYFYKRKDEVITVNLAYQGYIEGYGKPNLYGDGKFYYGKKITVTAGYNDVGYTFDGWYFATDSEAKPVSKETSLSFRAGTAEFWPEGSDEETLTAVFVPKQPDVPEVKLYGTQEYTYGYEESDDNVVGSEFTYPDETNSYISAYQWYEKVGNGEYAPLDGETSATLTFKTGKAAGTYTYKVLATSKLEANGNTKTVWSDERTVTVRKADMDVAAYSYTGVYDAVSHSPAIVVNEPVSGDLNNPYTVYYSTDQTAEKNYTAQCPSFTDVCSTTVYWYIKADGTSPNYNDCHSAESPGTVEVNITKATVAVIATASTITKVYDHGTDVVYPAGTGINDYLSVYGLLGTDELSVTAESAAYDSKNVDDASIITYTGLGLAGEKSGNYTLGSQNEIHVAGLITACPIQNGWARIAGGEAVSGIIEYSYDGNGHLPALVFPAEFSGSAATVEKEQTNAGSYKAEATINTILYNGEADLVSNYTFAELTRDFKILRDGKMSVTAQGHLVEYDGMDHSIDVTVSNPSYAAAVTIYYSTEKALDAQNYTDGQTENPVFRNVEMDGTAIKTHTVWYYVKDNTGNFLDAYGQSSVTITQKTLTVSGLKGTDKLYDGTKAAQLDYKDEELTGIVPGEDVQLDETYISGEFADANVGDWTVFISYASDSEPYGRRIFKVKTKGSDTYAHTDNYLLATEGNQTETEASITSASFAVTIPDINAGYYDKTDKVYTPELAYSPAKPLTRVNYTYSLEEEGTYTAALPALQKAKTHTVYFKAEAENYGTCSGQFNVTIEKKPISAVWTWEVSTSSVYDGKTHGITAGLNDVEDGDNVNPMTIDVVANTKVGSYSATISGISGTDSSNYIVTNIPLTCAWEITPKDGTESTVTVADVSALEYDGNKKQPKPEVKDTDRNVVLKEGQDFDYEYPTTGNTNVKDSEIWVKVNFKNNYKGTVTKKFSITPKNLTVTWTDPSGLIYDATEKTLTVGLSGICKSDDVSAKTTDESELKGTAAKTYSAKVNTLQGAKKDNYTVTESTHEWTITPKTLTVNWKDEKGSSVSGSASYYYTSEEHHVTPVLSGFAGQDESKIKFSTASTVDKEVTVATDAGTYTAKVTGISAVTAEDTTVNNYILPANSLKWIIEKAQIHVENVHVADKIYDGTVAATITEPAGAPSLKASEIQVNDGDETRLNLVKSAALKADFSDASVGRNKTVSFSGFELGGTAASNYELVQPTTTASISSCDVTVTEIAAVSRAYDGTTAAVIDTTKAVITGLKSGDENLVKVEKDTATAAFTTKDVVTDDTVTFTGTFKLTGSKAGNYTIKSNNTTATASIMQKEVKLQWSGSQSQTYDGTEKYVTAALTDGLISEEKIDLTVVNDKKTEGGDYTAEVTGLVSGAGSKAGTLASNYKLPSNTTYTWKINPAKLAVTVPEWEVIDGRNGNVTFKAVSGIGAVAVDHYELQLLEKKGASYAEVAGQKVTLDSATTRTDAFVDYIHNHAGSYKVRLKAVASETNNTGYANVEQYSGTSDSAVLHSVVLTYAYAENEDTTAAIDGVASIKLGSAAAQTEECSVVLVEKDTATSSVAVLRNETGYNASIAPVSGVSVTGPVTEKYGDLARTTAEIRVTGITDAQAAAGIRLSLSYEARPAEVSYGIVAKLNGATFRPSDYLIYGYEDGPELSLETAAVGDQVEYEISDYQWYFLANNDPLELKSVVATASFPTGQPASNGYFWYCGFTATRLDNHETFTVDWQKNSRTFTIRRAAISGIRLLFSKISGGETWTYGQPASGAKLDVTSNPDNTTVHYYYNPVTSSIAEPGWVPMEDGQDFPEDVGVYYFYAHMDESTNYDAYDTTNECKLTIEKAKLETPVSTMVIESGETPSVKVTWDPVAGMGDVTVTYDLTIRKGNRLNPGDVLVSYTGLSQTEQEVFNSIKDYYGEYCVEVKAVSSISENCDDSDTGIKEYPKQTLIEQTQNHTTEQNWIYDGKATVLSVKDAHPAEEKYQWYWNGAAIDGATSNVWSVKDVSRSGWYCCEVSNSNGSNKKFSNFIKLTITAQEVEIIGLFAEDRVYNAAKAATVIGTAEITPVHEGDTLTVNDGSASFEDKNAGTGKAVTFTGYSIAAGDGTELSNYKLKEQPAVVYATISQLETTITGIGAKDKEYDSDTAATITGTAVVAAKISGDAVTVDTTNAAASFANEHVGTWDVTFSGYSLTGADAANYKLTGQPATVKATISKKDTYITGITAENKVYDGSVGVTLGGTPAVSALISGDQVTVKVGTASFADKNVGTDKVLGFTGYGLEGDDAENYNLLGQPGTDAEIKANITKKTLTIEGVTAANKTYDAGVNATPVNDNAKLIGAASDDNSKLDDVSIDYTNAKAAFDSKNVGSRTVIFSGYALTGDDAGNYSLTQPASVTAEITPLATTISGIGATDKVYDSNTSVTITGNSSAVVDAKVNDSEKVSVDVTKATASFASRNAGQWDVTFSGYSLTGADAANYKLTAQPATVQAKITTKPVKITGLKAANKTYDGDAAATVTGTAKLDSPVDGDDVSIVNGSAAFADKNVGNNKTVTFSGYSLTGSDAGNYSLTQPASVTANITQKQLTISGVTAKDKIYDAKDEATPVNDAAVLVGVESEDEGKDGSGKQKVSLVTSKATANFSDKNVAVGKEVTFSNYAIEGSESKNYSLEQPAAVYATISQLKTKIVNIGAADKTYDASTFVTITGTDNVSISNKQGTDTVTVKIGTASFADKNVGENKVVSFSKFKLEGTDAANYELEEQPGADGSIKATISKKDTYITGITAENKVYDGSVGVTLGGTPAVSALIAGDQVTVKVGTASFADKNVGTDKVLGFTGYDLEGEDAKNYNLLGQPGKDAEIKANITQKTLTIEGVTAANKTYDAGVKATPVNDNAKLIGAASDDNSKLDDVSIDYTNAKAAFEDKKAEDGKTVHFSGYAITGDDAKNYTLEQPADTTADITKRKTKIVNIGAADKTYDASTYVTITGTDNAAISNKQGTDTVTVKIGTASFADKNVGENKVVSFSGFKLEGTDAENYELEEQPGADGSIKATIKKLDTAITGLSANGKTYDGTPDAVTDGTAVVSALISGDDVTVVSGKAYFADGSGNHDKKAGADKQVVFEGYSLTGDDAKNYNLTGQPADAKATISPASAGLSGIGAEDKIYDANTDATANGTPKLTGIVKGDNVSFTAGTAAFDSKNVGTGMVTFSGYALTGDDADNYLLTQPESVKAEITPLATTISGIGATDKVYDGNTSVTITGNSSAKVTAKVNDSEKVSVDATKATASFANKNAGQWDVTFSGYSLTGEDAANYKLTAQPATVKATISKKKVRLTGITAKDKIYDGTTDAEADLTGAVVDGLLEGDTLTIVPGTAYFDNEKPGKNKPVYFKDFKLTGDTNNYELEAQPADTTATIRGKYAVLHWLENLTETGYDLQENDTEYPNWKEGQMTDAKAKDYPGFTAEPITQKVVPADTSVTVDVKYSRNHYRVLFATPSGVTVSFEEKDILFGGTYGGGDHEGLPTAEKTGYTFTGWYTDPEGGDRIVPETVVGTDGERTLYPHFRANNYYVNYNGNGSTSGAMTKQSFTYDAEQALSDNRYARRGYTWTGWAYRSDAVNADFADQAGVLNLTAEDGKTIDLYALWTINSYNVSFDLNGGTGSVPDQLVVYGNKLTKPADPTKSGYTFVGWKYGEDLWNFDTDVVEQGMKLVAVWKQNYSGGESSGGGSGSSGPGTLNQASIYSEPISSAVPTTGDWVLMNPQTRVWKLNVGNGRYAAGGWAYVKNPYSTNGNEYAWFFFDEKGNMQYGWIRTMQPYAWYYANSDSNSDLGMLIKGWFNDPQDGNTYYLDPVTGKMHTGWVRIGGKDYYFETEGIEENKAWYMDVLDPNAGLNGWLYRTTEGRPLGSMYRNCMTPDGHFVNEKGEKVW